MKITAITALNIHPNFIVRVETDAGITGTGECSNMNRGIIAAHIQHALGPLVLGQDPFAIERLVETMFVKTYKLAGQAMAIAISGIEIALWDIMGRALQVPVYQLLGGSYRTAIPLYASSMRRDTTPAEEADALARHVERHGFKGVKIKVGGRQSFDADAIPGRSYNVVREVRQRLGPDVAILVDANSSYTPARAIELGRQLQQFNIYWYEEPCVYNDLDAHAQVAAALDVPIALGEQEWDLRRFRQMLQMHAAEVVQPDIIKCGGFLQTRKIATLAEAFGALCTPHQTSPFGTVANLHLAAATPVLRTMQEYKVEPPDTLGLAMFKDPPVIVDGTLVVPQAPGLGVDLRADLLEKADRLCHVA